MDISRLPESGPKIWQIGWRFQSDDLQEFEDNSYGVREKNLKLEDSTPAWVISILSSHTSERMVRQSRGFLIRHTFFLNSKVHCKENGSTTQRIILPGFMQTGTAHHPHEQLSVRFLAPGVWGVRLSDGHAWWHFGCLTFWIALLVLFVECRRCGGIPNSVNAENTPMDTYM
ncbi:hypothetical protein DTO164E3_7486 [Paecilomyces variotii]|nr:hypothetical protein DTO164E3_7486 [Paecilomyces variotii]KAJ9201525.1 hypothetical protein DTO032I3_4152 [Paecilomyces variotii]KAJ9275679.1 hypothetical protein DTO021D3_7499 [Paecilomyces variotii]KAJ9339961.1 hypothetical protein DTO027B6_7532 [Paecilomyces variotii]KAJ9377292.1 hypothetical protein DTO032I4_8209 [Paecilomyces variotii]